MLTVVGFVSGFINAVAGGGGLLVLPLMLWLGIPPVTALATGKFQAVFGTLSSSINYFRNGLIDFKSLWPVMFFSMIASACGTMIVLQLGNNVLENILPYFLIGISLFTWLSPNVSDIETAPLFANKFFRWSVGVMIGFYGGFFGPGVGAIAALAFSVLLGQKLRSATAHAKPVVLIANTVSVLIFLVDGNVLFTVGISMALAQIVGAYFGSNLAMKKGAAVIRPLLVVTTIGIAIKLLVD
ncbi:MAG: TSUP family transporter [Oceanicoccus sp.]